jgi:hypothetical protein
VELRVQNANGNDFFCFPVTDFVPGQSPTSDKQGVMRFHHVSTAVEWDEHGWSLFWVYGVQTTRSPEYVCRFFHRGKEIHRVAYENLQSWDWNGGWEDVPKVKRRWDWSQMIPNQIRYKANESDDDNRARLARFFHLENGNRPNREGLVACRNSCRLLERNMRNVNNGEPNEELEFPVIKRTITIK